MSGHNSIRDKWQNTGVPLARYHKNNCKYEITTKQQNYTTVKLKCTNYAFKLIGTESS